MRVLASSAAMAGPNFEAHPAGHQEQCVDMPDGKRRRLALMKALRRSEIDNVLALNDCAATVFENKKLKCVISWKENASAYRFVVKIGAFKNPNLKPARYCAVNSHDFYFHPLQSA